MFKLTVDPEDAPDAAETVTHRLRGAACRCPWTASAWGPRPWSSALNAIAGRHGVGRLDLVENRLVGIKSRGVYETPAGTVLYMAHREIERLVLDRNTLHFKQSVSVRYAQLIYDGLWFSTLRQALAAFVDFTERRSRARCACACTRARRRPSDAARRAACTARTWPPSAPGMAYDHKDAEGFIRLFGLPERVRALTRDAKPEAAAAAGGEEGDHGGASLTARRRRRRSRGDHHAPGLPRGRGGGGDQAGPARPRPPRRRRGRARRPASSPPTARWPRPVVVSREHLAGGRARAIVVNAGCANAATGERGPARRARDGGARRAPPSAARRPRCWSPPPA